MRTISLFFGFITFITFITFIAFTNFGSYSEKSLKYKRTEKFPRSPRGPRDCFAEKGSQDEKKDPPNQVQRPCGKAIFIIAGNSLTV